MVGASTERVNKAIASFIRLGWIEQSDRRYRITNREQLERRARSARDAPAGAGNRVPARSNRPSSWLVEECDGPGPGVGGVVGWVDSAVGVVPTVIGSR